MRQNINFDVIRELIRVAKIMEAQGLVNAYEGNLSILEDGLLYITPTNTRKTTLSEEFIAVLDENGDQVFGQKKPSSEIVMHTAVYGLRPDVRAVIHCHSPYLTAHAICHVPIDQKCHPEMMMRFRDIPVAPYGRPGTREIIDRAAPCLKERNLVLLGNHGVLAVGSTLELTLQRIEAAEKFAGILAIARGLGKTVDVPPDDVEYLMKMDVEV